MSCSRGGPIGSAWSRSNQISTAGTGGAAEAGIAVFDGVSGGRGTRGGVELRLEDGRGAPPGPNPKSTLGVHYLLLSLFVGVSSTTEGLQCQSRRTRTQ